MGSYLWADISQISGLIATKQFPNPFDYCDIVSTTAHKSLMGAKGALIFSNNKSKIDTEISKRIDFSIFPFIQVRIRNNN